jgi:hypothetical protein
MKVWINKDEWYPVYDMDSAIEDWVKEDYPNEIVEMDEELYRERKSLFDAFLKLQHELAEIIGEESILGD